MFRTSVEVTNPGLIEAYAQLLEQAPDVVNALVNRTVNREGDRVLADLRKEPGPAVHPIQWASDKQRKAYFASNGFGQGIPYRRRTAPNRLVDKWQLIITYEPNRLTSILLKNDDPSRRYVTGRDQQKFHLITGWYQEQPIIDRSRRLLASKVETDLIKGFYALEGR